MMISKKLLMIGTNILCKIYNCTKKEKEKLTTSCGWLFYIIILNGAIAEWKILCIWFVVSWPKIFRLTLRMILPYQSSRNNLPFINIHNQFINYIAIDSVRFHFIYHWNNRIFDKSILTESTLISISVMNYFQ